MKNKSDKKAPGYIDKEYGKMSEIIYSKKTSDEEVVNKSLDKFKKVLKKKVQEKRANITFNKSGVTKNKKEIITVKDIKEATPAQLMTKLEELVSKVVKTNITSKELSKFVALEFLEIYKQVNGRKKLIKYYKENPKELIRMLKDIATIGNEMTSADNVREGGKEGNKGAIINFIGVQPAPQQSEIRSSDLETVKEEEVIEIPK